MRALILSCNTGGGHNAAGQALLEKFQELARPYGVPAAVIPHQIYGLIDGNALLDMAVRLAAGKQEGEKQDG